MGFLQGEISPLNSWVEKIFQQKVLPWVKQDFPGQFFSKEVDFRKFTKIGRTVALIIEKNDKREIRGQENEELNNSGSGASVVSLGRL